MPQFAVYRNPDPATRGRFPLLLDVQSDLLQPLATRVVVPLSQVASAGALAMKPLAPILTIGKQQYIMLTPQLAGISTHGLGPPVADLSADRAAILAALDFLVTGI